MKRSRTNLYEEMGDSSVLAKILLYPLITLWYLIKWGLIISLCIIGFHKIFFDDYL